MSAKEYLTKLLSIDLLIECKLNQITELRTLLSGGAVRYDKDKVQSSLNPDKIPSVISKIIELEKDIDSEVDKLIDYKREAKEFIEQLQDDVEKVILYKRYFENKTFEQISVECNYSWRWTIKLHGNALQSLECVMGDKLQG